jgi:hypothetical protein
MKMKPYAVATLAIFIALLSVNVIAASSNTGGWSEIGTGYAETSNYQGVDVPILTDVRVIAGTTDLSITNIVFRWHDPSDNVVWEENIPVSGPLTTPSYPANAPQSVINWATDPANNGIEYLYAFDTHAPNVVGDWGVQAFFIGPDGKSKAGLEEVVQTRSTSFNAIPEVPVVGTVGAMAAMLLGLVFFLKKKGKLV